MSRTSFLPLALALACARTPTADPGPTGTALVQQDPAFAAAAAQARSERLIAFAAANIEGERYQVPVAPTDLSFGAEQGASVTFVAFIDYQCPYSNRLDEELRALAETYPTGVRVIFKHFPLPMHKRAQMAARAVLAASDQGRGQAMHALVFESAQMLEDEDLRKLAAQAQVTDLERFWADVSSGVHDLRIDADRELANKLAVSSTPTFFVNGIPHRGAKSLEQLREIHATELGAVDQLLDAGATAGEVYDLWMAVAKPERERPPAKPTETQPPRVGTPDRAAHYAVPVDGRPTRGRADARVTIIEFADFECPYSKKVQSTLSALAHDYGDDLRIVYRHQPLPFHKSAEPAALAAIAADRQGQFWAMHDALFAASKEQLADPSFLVDTANQLGLDLKRFRADLQDAKAAAIISDDQATAARFGAGGTPAFFINGRFLAGAQPIESFKALIDEELAAAQEFALEHKVSRDKLYATMAKGWVTEVKPPPLATHSRQAVDVSKLAGKGKLRKPAITLVMCGDFDCPYTSRGVQNVEQILTTAPYEDKVGFYFMHFPLPMHTEAMGAHQAAVAADKQGKFWEMHDLLFADRKRRGRAEFAAMARQLGLDVDLFLADFDSPDTHATIDADIAACQKLGVTGTPHFLVNGRSMRGAFTFDLFAEVLDEELAGGYEKKAGKSK